MVIACLTGIGSLQVFRYVIVCKPKAFLTRNSVRLTFQLIMLEDLETQIYELACKPPKLGKFCFSNENEKKYIFVLFLHS